MADTKGRTSKWEPKQPDSFFHAIKTGMALFCKKGRECNMHMKKNLLLAAILSVLLVCSACRDAQENANSSSQPDSSTQGSSQALSSEASSEINDMFPESSEPQPDSRPEEDPTSSGKDVATLAQPIETAGVDLAGLDQLDTQAVTWGPGHAMDEENRPTACTQLQQEYGEHGAVFLLPDTEKNIYLTFDEGYENGYTSQILDVLREKECPAVFFVTMDYVNRNPELIQRMIDEGHVVGNHSVNHLSMPDLDNQTAVEEIAGLHNEVLEKFNYHMSLFRPPEGKWSEKSLELAKRMDYRTVLWSFAYADYDVNNQPDPQAAFERITSAAHSGAVYLLHAVSKTNTEILGDVIDNLRGQGYTFAKLQ